VSTAGELRPVWDAHDAGERLRLTLEFSGVGDWSWDPVTDLVDFSPVAHRIFGTSPNARFTWRELQETVLHPADAPRAEAAVREAVERREQYRIEYRIRRPADGEEAWILASARAAYDETGTPIAMWGLVQDVTERKALEQRLRDSEAEAHRVAALLEAIGRSSPDLIYAKDLESRTIYANEATLAVLGLPLHEVVGKTAAQYALQAEEGEAHAANDRQVMATGRVEVSDEVFTSPDGTTRTFRSTKAPLRDLDGQIMGVVGVSVDVTDRSATEARLLRQTAQLQRLADAALVVTQAADLQSTLDEITRSAREIIGAHQAVVSLTRGADWSQAINAVALTEKYEAWRGYAEATSGDGVYAWVCETNRPVRMTQAELEAHPRWRGFGKARDAHPPMRGWLAAPLVGRDGRNLGLIQLSDKADGGEFDETDQAVLVQLAQLASAAVEQAQAEEALRASEQRLRIAQRAAKAVTWEHDLAAQQTVWSDAEALRDLTGAEFAGVTTLSDWTAIVHPEDKSAYFRQWEEVLKSGEGRVAFRILAGGETRWLEVFAQVTEWVGDAPRTLVGISIDITAREAAAKALADSESRLRLAIEAGRMAVWEHDARTDEVSGSPDLSRLLGLAPDAPLDLEAVRARYHPGDLERVRAVAADALERGERFFEAEYRFHRFDDEWRWFLIRAEFELGPTGAPSRTMGVVLDVTSRKQIEESLRERDAELQAALDAGTLAIVDYDHDRGVFRHSARLSQLYGFGPEHVLTIADVRSRYHPEDEAEIYERSARELADTRCSLFTWVMRIRLPDGEVRWVEGRGEYVRDEAGVVRRSRGVVMDITERKRWEEHQRLLVNELNHRVKNTLAVVQALARQTFRGSNDPETAVRSFEARLGALSAAHNLLTRQNWEKATLSEIVDTAVQATAGSNDRRIHWSGADLHLAPQTAVSLALAVHELCTNAIKYGALSNDDGRVEVEWSTASDTAGRSFTFEWREIGGPPVSPPNRRGFGTRMIERGLAGELDGEVFLQFEPDGVLCRIHAPMPG